MELDKRLLNDFIRVDAQIRSISLELASMQSTANALMAEQAEAVKERSALYVEAGLDEKTVLVVPNKRTVVQETGATIAQGRVLVRGTDKDYVPPAPEEIAAAKLRADEARAANEAEQKGRRRTCT